MKIAKLFLCNVSAVALAALASPASATIVVTVGGTIANPAFSNDFESISADPRFFGGIFFPRNQTYSQGGISINYVEPGASRNIWTTYEKTGNFGWYPDGGGFGYNAITLTNGGAFDQFQFDAGTGAGRGLASYQLLFDGSVVTSGTAGPVDSNALTTYTFSGGGFNEVRLMSRVDGSGGYSAGAYEALALDNLSASVSGAVPEPSTWAMMILGFGFVGGAMRSAKRRQNASVSYA